MSKAAMFSLMLVMGIAMVGCNGAGAGLVAIQGAGTEADPVQIPFASEIKIDGDAGEWTVASLPLPFMKKDSGSVSLCWGEDGLYGLVKVADKAIEVDAQSPWMGDCIEVWIEKDFARAVDRTDNAAQYVFAPNPDGKPGECIVVIPWGGENDLEEDLKCAWKKTPRGYVLEFMISAKLLAPAKMAAGTKIGLNYAVDDGGEPVEQFFSDKDIDDGYRTPSSWGAAVFVK